MQILSNYKPNDMGYKLFFTNTSDDTLVVPMAYARAINKRNSNQSDPQAMSLIKDDYFSGALHFGRPVERDENKKFFDLDLKSAYPTWLLNYGRKKLPYKIGGNKRYFSGLDVFRFDVSGLRIYRIKFVVKVKNAYKSRLYRLWFLKATKITGFDISNNMMSGTINIPDIENMVNRFLDDVQYYDDAVVKIASVIVASGDNAVYINSDNIAKAMAAKYNKNHPLHNDIKLILNSSTGYLAVADKVMYFTMVNQVKLETFKFMDAIDRWNRKRPDLTIDIVAGNTDGFTVYGDPKIKWALKEMIDVNLNPYSEFKFTIKEEYGWNQAHFTNNDIRRKKDGETTETIDTAAVDFSLEKTDRAYRVYAPSNF